VKLQWKVPTWPGVIGLIGAAAATATQIAGVLPPAARAWMAGVSGALILGERVMQAVDYRSLVVAAGQMVTVRHDVALSPQPPGPPPAPVPPSTHAAVVDAKDAEIAALQAKLTDSPRA
jgi:hypothetical protein